MRRKEASNWKEEKDHKYEGQNLVMVYIFNTSR